MSRITKFSNVAFYTIAFTWHLTGSKLSGAAFKTYGLVTVVSHPAFIAGADIGSLTHSIYTGITVGDSAVTSRPASKAFTHKGFIWAASVDLAFFVASKLGAGLPHPTEPAVARVRHSAISIRYATAVPANN